MISRSTSYGDCYASYYSIRVDRSGPSGGAGLSQQFLSLVHSLSSLSSSWSTVTNLHIPQFHSMTHFFFTAALTGYEYETITVFQSDFNATPGQTSWFDQLLPFHEPKPGALCAGHVFNIEDPFTTNYSFFNWNVDSIIRPNAGQSGMLSS